MTGHAARATAEGPGNGSTVIHLLLEGEEASLAFAADLACALKSGDVICLQGDLGAGKTTIARAVIRHWFDDPEMEVPSPTFSLVQAYEASNKSPIQHCDLYRLSEPSELEELGILDQLGERITLVEWPDQAGDLLSGERVELSLTETDGGNGREVEISGPADFMARLARSLEIRAFLDQKWNSGIKREPFPADASQRRYEHCHLGDEHRILMDAPRMADGPPIKDGKPYSRIAHLAEDVVPFVAIGKLLAQKGFKAPSIYATDPDNGLVLLEHLGDKSIITAERAPIEARYMASMAMLADLHQADWPKTVEVAPGLVHDIPSYDADAMGIELELMTDWYAPRFAGKLVNAGSRKAFSSIWGRLIAKVSSSEQSLVLRDYHSPNIIWREDASGNDRVGLIDFQDALIGPSAYDVASLAMDARVDIPGELETTMTASYVELRKHQSTGFDEAVFREAYAIMAAQRATKILGIFVRLDERDGKPTYLSHLPRMRDYLERATRHPTLTEYRSWLVEHGLLKAAT